MVTNLLLQRGAEVHTNIEAYMELAMEFHFASGYLIVYPYLITLQLLIHPDERFNHIEAYLWIGGNKRAGNKQHCQEFISSTCLSP